MQPSFDSTVSGNLACQYVDTVSVGLQTRALAVRLVNFVVEYSVLPRTEVPGTCFMFNDF